LLRSLAAAASEALVVAETSEAAVAQEATGTPTTNFGKYNANPTELQFKNIVAPNSVDEGGNGGVNDSAEKGDKLCCSYKKCNNALATKEQIVCAVRSCKKNHLTCFHHYISQASFDFEVREMSFVVLLKLVILNSKWIIRVPPLTGTPMDQTDQILFPFDWWTTGDTWCVCRSGKNSNGKTTMIQKEQTWKMLSERIDPDGITVSRKAKSVGAKLSRMEGEYKKAFDFVNNTGQGLMEDRQDITDIVKKMYPYFYELDSIMGSRASICPLDLFESEGDAAEFGNNAAKLDDLFDDSKKMSISSNTIYNNVEATADASGNGEISNANKVTSAKKKWPLS
jgi:hypothetical protein